MRDFEWSESCLSRSKDVFSDCSMLCMLVLAYYNCEIIVSTKKWKHCDIKYISFKYSESDGKHTIPFTNLMETKQRNNKADLGKSELNTSHSFPAHTPE